MKNIVLIRHGESLGQTARKRGTSRSDPSLQDCFLSSRGVREAQQLRSNDILQQYSFDLVCVSPLTRALSTSILGLGHIIEQEEQDKEDIDQRQHQQRQHQRHSNTRIPFIARADICEFGGIPENHGTPLRKLIKSVKEQLSTVSGPSSVDCLHHIDFSMLPLSWPDTNTNTNTNINTNTKTKTKTKTNTQTNANTNIGGKGNRKGNRNGKGKGNHKRGIESFMSWLSERPEENIAIVCHYNVIRWMLQNVIHHVPNCTPIECILTDEGELILKSRFEDVE